MECKHLFTIGLLSCLLAISIPVFGQQSGGDGTGFQPELQKQEKAGTQVRTNMATLDEGENVYSTTLYTFDEIIVFAFFDNTEITIVDEEADTLVTEVLDKNEELSYMADSDGVFHVYGSNSFSTMMGDMLTNSVQGYFAVDQGGHGTSTLLHTYMMYDSWEDEEFIVFAYEDNTRFTISNMQTGEVLHSGFLNADEYFALPETPYEQFLQVSSNNPVSALSYADTDYYVPSSSGLFSGTEFLGYSGNIGGWTNSITVVGYHDDTEVTITDLDTGEEIDSYILNEGEVQSEPIVSEVYWKVEASEDVTTANIPYADHTGNYLYLATVSDRDGLRAGELFYVPTIGGQMDVFSFTDNNEITITLLGEDDEYPYEDTEEILIDTLDSGQSVRETIPSGRYVYKVEGSDNLAVIQSNGGWGADFMPLRHSLELPNLMVNERDITYSTPPDEAEPGDEIEVEVRVANQGVLDAENVPVQLFSGERDDSKEGDSSGKLANQTNSTSAHPIAADVIDHIPAKDNGSANLKFVFPEDADYRNYSLVIDPDNTITQANISNNSQLFSLIENKDLDPPIASYVDAPSGLSVEQDEFTASVTLFNIEEEDLEDVTVELRVLDGLALDEQQEAVVELGTIEENGSETLEWNLSADRENPGFNRYEIHLDHDSIEDRVVKRSVNVKSDAPPSVPENFTVSETDAEGTVHLNWDAPQVSDIEGYVLYYGTESGVYDGTGSDRGDSPVNLSTYEELELSGLAEGETYYFAIRSLNSSGQTSDQSEESSVVVPTSVQHIASENPDEFRIAQNYPNPFNPVTNIEYALPENAEVQIEVFDLLGRQVEVLVSERQQAGNYAVSFNAEGLSSGTYIYRIRAGNFVETRQMMLVK